MKSIRHSLIVYFIVLLTGALGAVSWSAYRTTTQSLRQRQRDSQTLIEAQFSARAQAVRDELDRRLRQQVQTMASTAHASTVHFNGLYPLGVAGASVMGEPFLHVPVWLAQGTYPSPIIPRPQTDFTQIKIAADFIQASHTGHTEEFFQTYLRNGHMIQRSESMGEHRFTLDEKMRDHLVLWTESFDETDLKPGVHLRRVTLKALVAGNRPAYIPWQSIAPLPRSAAKGPKSVTPMPKPDFRHEDWRSKPTPPKWFPPYKGGFDAFTTAFFQYAADLAPTEAKVLGFQKERDEQLAQLESTLEDDLRQSRSHMLWIALFTLAAFCIGGYFVIRLGLAPLAKMSDAVSKVSAQNFHLPLDEKKLPQELQPIAARLGDVLEELGKAFAREKQAAADISHELRTPLAALMTNLELGLRKPRSSAEYREILDECHASGQHMYQLIERLLTLARLDAGADQYRPSDVDAIEIALQCADLIRPLARARDLELRLNVPDPVTLRTDPDKLREVLTNLLHNAVEYNKPSGAIELSVERKGGQVRMEVRNTGVGISAAGLEHIFERFYRADPSRHADTPHAGLGLAIVKSYVDLMGGVLRVASSEGGTVFTVLLPAGDMVASSASPAPASAAGGFVLRT